MNDEVFSCKFGNDLATKATRRPGRRCLGQNQDFGNFDFSLFSHRSLNCSSFGANRCAERGILNVASLKDLAIRRSDRCPHLATTIRGIGMFSCLSSRLQKFFKIWRGGGFFHILLLFQVVVTPEGDGLIEESLLGAVFLSFRHQYASSQLLLDGSVYWGTFLLPDW